MHTVHEPGHGSPRHNRLLRYVGSVDAFEISPDGSHAAISINQNLYIIPFDREMLGESRYWTDVRDMSVCQAMAPYASNTGTAFSVKQVRWSNDMQYLAIVLLAAEAGVRVDKVVVVDISNCDQYVDKLDEFPGASRFEISGYMNHPVLENVAWDGMFLFAMIGYIRNEGFGDLYLYNWDLHRATLKANPIGNTCCYRDPSWSPDGSHLMFAYQDIGLGPEGTIQLYIIPYGTLGTGLQYAPIPLPDDFFTDPKESPQPVLRPAQIGD